MRGEEFVILIKSVQNIVKRKHLIMDLFQKMSVFFDVGIQYYLTAVPGEEELTFVQIWFVITKIWRVPRDLKE